jgi:hypothetical protein
LERLFAAFREWSVAWGLSRLPRDASIEFDDRLGAALGLCDLRAGRILLSAVLLLPENERLLHETLCHEAAHLVVFLRYGTGVAEHGPEWQEAMRRAGFSPRAVIPAGRVPGLSGGRAVPVEPINDGGRVPLRRQRRAWQG